ncbi:hypothetical protein GDO81_012527 [Engystomops pustulosus]|uniref:Uncharacterized protein n=1 Tax=Engystomops pustulosus TaxID=76066 RepID=A0AAV7BNC3_ENGPU|nr:hypothetical protein GDO81_012527 [Engystomops pustulosus]
MDRRQSLGPVRACPTLSHRSRISPQSSVVLSSLVAFSTSGSKGLDVKSGMMCARGKLSAVSCSSGLRSASDLRTGHRAPGCAPRYIYIYTYTYTYT